MKMHLAEIGCDGVDSTGLAEDGNKWRALVNAVMNLRVPSNAGKLSSGYTTVGHSSSAQLHRVSITTECDNSNYAWRRVQIMKLLVMQSSSPPLISSLFGPNILLSTLFSNTLRLCSSVNVRDQVSHPYRTNRYLGQSGME
jgi:hypothetical protein